MPTRHVAVNIHCQCPRSKVGMVQVGNAWHSPMCAYPKYQMGCLERKLWHCSHASAVTSIEFIICKDSRKLNQANITKRISWTVSVVLSTLQKVRCIFGYPRHSLADLLPAISSLISWLNGIAQVRYVWAGCTGWCCMEMPFLVTIVTHVFISRLPSCRGMSFAWQ